MSDFFLYETTAPKEVAHNLMPIFYRLRYQKSPSWFRGLTESDVRSWKHDNSHSQQVATVRALQWVAAHPSADLTGVIRNMNRSNHDIHAFCHNFLESLGRTGFLAEFGA
jgi:hypothetical protein